MNETVKQTPNIVLDDWNMLACERKLCAAALEAGGSIVTAAALLGITRHALKRRIIKLKIDWPPRAWAPEPT